MGHWDSDRHAILPVLRALPSQGGLDPFVGKTVGDDLIIRVARRRELSSGGAYLFEFIAADEVADWGVDPDEIFRVAYSNFAGLEHGGQRVPDDSGDLVILDRFGSCSAAAVGSQACIEWFRDLGETLVIGVPSRDRVFVSARQSRMAKKVADAVRHFYMKDEHPVSDKVYLWTPSSLEIWNHSTVH